jgi:hypothetical protein
MNKLIIYLQDNNTPAIICPTEDALKKYGIMAIAVKDVPEDKPFKIIDASDLPLNVPQSAWAVSESDLTDGVGGKIKSFFVVGV